MTPADVADQFAGDQRRQAEVAAAATVGRFRQVDRDDIIGSWARLLPAAVSDVTFLQARAADRGARYTADSLRLQGVASDPAGSVNTPALAGVASDGRPLETLLAFPAHQAVGRMAAGATSEQALSYGRHLLGMLAGTQVYDAGRMGASVSMTADRAVGGYRRQLTPPSCSRCAVLAGKWFRWNQGFQRHPQCDCVHVPAVGPKSDLGGLETFDPQAYFDGLDSAAQDRLFTKSGAEAIRDGADMSQVVNARRGMRSTRAYGQKVSTTLEGTGRSGRVRLMPEQIYADATSRDDAIRLLRRFGYLTD